MKSMKTSCVGRTVGCYFGIMVAVGLYVQAEAAPIPPGARVVEVQSSFCHESPVNLRGSGILFQREGEVYVLTSEHVILHANEEFCHCVSNEILGTQKAVFIAADWTLGLGLLKLREKLSPVLLAQIPGLSQFATVRVQVGSAVVTTGFPYQSKFLVVFEGGSVLNSKSKRHRIPLLPEVIEIVRSHGEYGMSGGAVLTASEEEVIGILSHQFLKWFPGEGKEVSEFELEKSAASTVESHLLVIPSDVAVEWIQRYFQDPLHFKPVVWVDPLSRILGKTKIIMSGLQFELKSDEEVLPVKQGEIIEIAGSGEGVGIGGVGRKDNPLLPAGVGKTIQISLDLSKDILQRDDQAGPTEKNQFLDELRRTIIGLGGMGGLGKKEPVEIRFLMNSAKHSKTVFQGLSEFFQYFLNPDYKPIVLLESSKDSPKLLALRKNAEKLQNCSHNLLARINENPSTKEFTVQETIGFIDAKSLLQEVEVICEFLKSDRWVDISVEQLEALRTQKPKAWGWLFSDPYSSSVEIMKNLVELEEGLKTLRKGD